MTATITIITQSADNVVLVPNAAISNGRVGVLRNGNVTPVAVVTGITDGVNTQIISGLQPGDQVVIGIISANGSRSGSSSASGGSSIFGFGAPAGGGGGNRGSGQPSGGQPSGGQPAGGSGGQPAGGSGGQPQIVQRGG
jgi:HlyD family secretion protein